MAVGAAAIPGAQLTGLAGCGHAIQLDGPAEYGAAVRGILDSVPPG